MQDGPPSRSSFPSQTLFFIHRSDRSVVVTKSRAYSLFLWPLAHEEVLVEQASLSTKISVGFLLALGVLGAGIAYTVYGNRVRWAVALIVAGVVLSVVGIELHIV